MVSYYIILLLETTHTLTILATGRIFIMIKSDGVHCSIKRFETRGFDLITMKFVQVSVEHLVSYCAGLTKKLIFPGSHVTVVWEGLDGVKTERVMLVETERVMLVETNPANSKPGTIRGDFCRSFWQQLLARV